MTYSCGIFDDSTTTLGQASLAKYERICKKLRLSPSDHVLEIGSGWGGFAVYAAKQYGCRVTTTTISRQQYDVAKERIVREGLADRVHLLLEDYRNLRGRYDKLVSIEMIEAVGHAYYETYFKQCAALLNDNGQMLLQAITIDDGRYDAAKRAVDFIQHYMFPGSCIPSVTALCQAMTRASDLRLVDLEDIGAHYSLTLRAWRKRLLANAERIKALGFSPSFLRMWEYYFAYCEGGFLERSISDVQMVLVKPFCRNVQIPRHPGHG